MHSGRKLSSGGETDKHSWQGHSDLKQLMPRPARERDRPLKIGESIHELLLSNKLPPKLCGLKRHMYVRIFSHNVCGSELWAQLLRVSHKGAVKEPAGAGVCPEAWSGGGPTCKPSQWLLGRLSSSPAVGSSASVPRWRAVGHRLPQLLIMWVFPTWQLASSRCASLEGKRESVLARQTSLFLWNPIADRTSQHLCYILLVRGKSQIWSTLKGRDDTRVWISGGEDYSGHLGRFLPLCVTHFEFMEWTVIKLSEVITQEALLEMHDDYSSCSSGKKFGQITWCKSLPTQKYHCMLRQKCHFGTKPAYYIIIIEFMKEIP